MDIEALHSTTMDLNALRVFVAVAEAASFSAAAKRLGLPKWSVSRRVASLEAAMGVPLLHRTTRHVALSPAGAALCKRIAPLLSSLEQAVSELPERSGDPAGELRVTAPIDLGSTLLADAVTRFTARYPAVRIDIYLTSRVLDLAVEGFDIAIRTGPARMKDSSLVVRAASPIAAQLFASPTYLARHGTPRSPSDLAGHECVVFRGLPPVRLDSPGGSATFEPHGRICSDDIFFVREALRAGAGIGILPTFLAERDVAGGQLVRVLPRYRTPAGYVYIVRPATREVPRRVTALSDFLLAYLKAHPLAALAS
jgi:DNA-binding transcriptional LysR family regulator